MWVVCVGMMGGRGSMVVVSMDIVTKYGCGGCDGLRMHE